MLTSEVEMIQCNGWIHGRCSIHVIVSPQNKQLDEVRGLFQHLFLLFKMLLHLFDATKKGPWHIWQVSQSVSKGEGGSRDWGGSSSDNTRLYLITE